MASCFAISDHVRFFFCVCEMLKEEANINHSRTENDRKVNVQNKAFSFSPVELRSITNRISVRCEAFPRAEGNHIKRLFLNAVNKLMVIANR